MIKRYGDNVSSNCHDEPVNAHGQKAQVLNAGCGVRYDMIAYIHAPEAADKSNLLDDLFSLLKIGRKKAS